MKRFIFIILVLISPFLCLNVNSLEEISLYSPNYIIYDVTDDKIVKSNNVDVVTAPASLTKIMTTIIAIECINNLDEKVVYTNEMKTGIDFDASLAGLKVGEAYTYRDLLYASMLPSGADATNALAYSLCGSVPAFVNLMNDKAASLGMSNTHYVNVTGLDIDNNYSTVEDVFKLLKYSLENDLFKTIYTTKSYHVSNSLNNRNLADPYLVESTVSKAASKIGLDPSRIIGAKTGYTDNAGQCISFIFNSNGHDYIAITTKAKFVMGMQAHIRDAVSIVNYIDNNYNNQILLSEGTLIDEVSIELATVNKYEIKANKDTLKYLSNDYDKTKVEVKYDGVHNIKYNYDKDKPLGKIIISYDGKEVATEEVYLNEKLELSVSKLVNKYKELIIMAFIGLLLLIFLLMIIGKKRNRRRHRKQLKSA